MRLCPFCDEGLALTGVFVVTILPSIAISRASRACHRICHAVSKPLVAAEAEQNHDVKHKHTAVCISISASRGTPQATRIGVGGLMCSHGLEPRRGSWNRPGCRSHRQRCLTHRAIDRIEMNLCSAVHWIFKQGGKARSLQPEEEEDQHHGSKTSSPV